MSLDKDEFTAIVKELRGIEDIKFDDIPDMDMYMEQMLSFLNQKLEPYKRDFNGKILTKPMINNYTKSQLLLPPNNKKYGKEHIVLLALVFQLKGILSISDIQRLFGPILKDMSTPDDDVISLKDIYASYLQLKNAYWEEFNQNFADKIAFIRNKTSSIIPENQRTAELFLLILTLTAQANSAKRTAEILIDMFFPKPGGSHDNL